MSILSAANQKRVEEALLADKLLSPADLSTAHNNSKNKNIPLFSLLVTQKKISNEDLTKAIARVTKLPYVNLLESTIDPKILSLLPKDVAERYMAVPLGDKEGHVIIAMLDAENVQAVDFISKKVGKPLKVYAASQEGVKHVLDQYKGAIGGDVASALDSQIRKQAAESDTAEPEDIVKLKNESPISKVLSSILDYAAKSKASDIHIEPLEHELKIRARVDGVLREVMRLPKSIEAPLTSRIKILSNLKIDEHRIPQDGQFTVSFQNRSIDLRVSISPVVWGQQVVLRLLDKTGSSFKLGDMGYIGRSLTTIRRGLTKSNGMILTSGPTGSGKSTSIYALLQEIKNDQINIVALEDPVEYKMDGINQIQVNAAVGLNFANGLRSILRQDPDVVMVGEIRDAETATLAVQAALTGHLVFSTLHTNSAAGILPRLLDMDIEPFLIASTVHTVIGQRLMRRLVDEKESYQSSQTETEAVNATIGHLLPKTADEVASVSASLGYSNLPLAGQKAYTLFRGKKTPSAPGGLKGRMGLYEVFEVDDEIQQLILQRATSSQIQQAAQAKGMVTMRQDGYLKALSGFTTLQEVDRVAAANSA